MKKIEKTKNGFRFGERFLPRKQQRLLQQESQIEQKKGNSVLMSVSSETPAWRGFLDAWEVLDHSDNAIDLTWFQSGKSLVLFNHDRDRYLGRIDRAFIEDKILYIESSFKDCPEYEDLKNGFLSATSISYEIYDLELMEEADQDVVLVTNWKPLEASLVTLPADETVGYQGDYSEQESEEEKARSRSSFNIP